MDFFDSLIPDLIGLISIIIIYTVFSKNFKNINWRKTGKALSLISTLASLIIVSPFSIKSLALFFIFVTKTMINVTGGFEINYLVTFAFQIVAMMVLFSTFILIISEMLLKTTSSDGYINRNLEKSNDMIGDTYSKVRL